VCSQVTGDHDTAQIQTLLIQSDQRKDSLMFKKRKAAQLRQASHQIGADKHEGDKGARYHCW
jgi:hypothetical protein